MHHHRGAVLAGATIQRDCGALRVAFHADAKLAVTHYRTIESKGAYSMLEVTLETGRMARQAAPHLAGPS